MHRAARASLLPILGVCFVACLLAASPQSPPTPAGISAGVDSSTPSAGGRVRAYFIAADEVVWDYAPSGTNLISGQPFNAMEQKWMVAGPHTVGRKLKKALYREYTDASFTTLAVRPATWAHLGFLGPVIRAEVGDTIHVTFRNNAAFPASVHPHGVFYAKDSEGAPYADGTSGADKADDGVPPGGTHVYTWQVPERAGPDEHEGSTAFWMYHSHVDEDRDVAAGLLGPMIITRRGMAKPDGSPTDVDRELVLGFIEVDENVSWYLDDNVKTYATDPAGITTRMGSVGQISVAPEPGTYVKETINGYSYGNTPGLTVKLGERVRWYVMGSTNFEFHSPHWHGNVVTIGHMRTDVGALLPMGMFIADMVPDDAGTWLVHCHVSDHLRMGMQALYTVTK
jgi:FtsP/CotA-like multicopper oxidase with cupredoxin domain